MVINAQVSIAAASNPDVIGATKISSLVSAELFFSGNSERYLAIQAV